MNEFLIISVFLCVLCVPILSQGGMVRVEKRGLLGHGEVYTFIFCILPIFFAGLFLIGFRPLDAGYDTANYIKTYLSLDGFFTAREVGEGVYGNSEILWWPLQSLFSQLISPRFWLVLNYLAVFVSVYFGYRVLGRIFKISPLLFGLVFFTYYFVYTGNALRQSLSLPFGMLAFFYFYESKYFRSILFLCVSIGMHWSAVFFILTPFFRLPVFKKKWVYILTPLIVLGLSPFIGEVAKLVVDLLSIPALKEKYDLYFSVGRESHVGVVWRQFNFWFCFLLAYFFLVFSKLGHHAENMLHHYVLLFLSLICFGILVPDFSERFFPALLLVSPALATLIARKFKIPSLFLEAGVILSFFVLWVLVLMSGSSQTTLSYNLL